MIEQRGSRSLILLFQYNHLGFFPHLVEHKDAIVTQIREFYANVALPRLKPKFDTYVIDFALIDLGVTPKYAP